MKKNNSRLPASELSIMILLWAGHPEMSRLEIEQAFEEGKHLAPTTINTLLSRLESKGFITVTRKGKTNYYTPLITKKEYQHQESHSIVEQLFEGSVACFVASLYDGETIPVEKKEELESFLSSLDWETEEKS